MPLFSVIKSSPHMMMTSPHGSVHPTSIAFSLAMLLLSLGHPMARYAKVINKNGGRNRIDRMIFFHLLMKRLTTRVVLLENNDSFSALQTPSPHELSSLPYYAWLLYCHARKFHCFQQSISGVQDAILPRINASWKFCPALPKCQ